MTAETRLDVPGDYWRIVGAGASVVVSVAVAVGVVRADASVGSATVAVAALALGALAAVRCWRVRLVDEGDVVTVRNVLRTRRLPWRSITAVSVRHGLTSRPGNQYAYVSFRTGRRWVRAVATLTYSEDRATRICDGVRVAAAAHGVPCAVSPDELQARWWGSSS